MDKLSISNLFPINNMYNVQNTPLDVHSLYNTKDQKIINKVNFSMEKMIKIRKERKEKILIQYEKI